MAAPNPLPTAPRTASTADRGSPWLRLAGALPEAADPRSLVLAVLGLILTRVVLSATGVLLLGDPKGGGLADDLRRPGGIRGAERPSWFSQRFWSRGVGLVAYAWAFSDFWSAFVRIYLLLRREVDDTPWDDVDHPEEDNEPFAPDPIRSAPARVRDGGPVTASASASNSR